MISTTINIHTDVLFKITFAAGLLDISKKDIIVMLMMRMMKDQHAFERYFTTVRYQPDDAKDKWHCFHVRLKADVNEYFVDLRKLCKCSVSCLLAIAVNRYLDDLLHDGENAVDNNPFFMNYVLFREVYDGIISWRFYWGYTEKLTKTLRL